MRLCVQVTFACTEGKTSTEGMGSRHGPEPINLYARSGISRISRICARFTTRREISETEGKGSAYKPASHPRKGARDRARAFKSQTVQYGRAPRRRHSTGRHPRGPGRVQQRDARNIMISTMMSLISFKFPTISNLKLLLLFIAETVTRARAPCVCVCARASARARARARVCERVLVCAVSGYLHDDDQRVVEPHKSSRCGKNMKARECPSPRAHARFGAGRAAAAIHEGTRAIDCAHP